jgi:hypothetical protein
MISKVYFAKYSNMFQCLYMIYMESFLMDAEVTKFCTFTRITRKKGVPEDDVNTSKRFGVLYETDINVNILCIRWSK